MHLFKFLRRTDASLLMFACLLTILIICPLVMIFAKAVIYNDRLDLSSAWQILSNHDNITTITNSLLLGLSVVITSTVIALPLAFLLARTELAKHHWLDIVLLIPFMTPPYISSMGWILFMQKKGLLQQLIPSGDILCESFFSFFGLVMVMSLHIFPFLLAILKNALLNIPSALEESGAVFSGNFIYRLRRIIIPLLLGNYAIGALLVFVKTLAEYGTPATLGHRIGFYVFTTDIHRYATTAPISFEKAASLSALLIVICISMWLLQNHITTRRTYSLTCGKGAKRELKSLKGSAYVLSCGYIILIIFLAIIVPYFSVISTSLIKLRGYGLAIDNLTLQHYIDLFTQNSKGIQAILTGIILSLSSATAAAIIGTLLVTVLRHSKSRLRKCIEIIGLLPEMLPSIVVVIGIMLFWNSIYHLLSLYNTLVIMIITYTVLFLPYTIQYVTSSFMQISDSLLQAGRTFGGKPHYIFLRITLPLISKGVLTAWLLTFIISFRELVASSMISPPNTLVVSTFIVREFEQGSVSIGMAMAVICVLFSTVSLIIINTLSYKSKHIF